ncbi:MAG TPA: hypothetical protein VKZ53_18365 [Candidatus Angelobacter sp.]|nr:hypothetical protein [Candidatus Angelobacter sp.]
MADIEQTIAHKEQVTWEELEEYETAERRQFGPQAGSAVDEAGNAVEWSSVKNANSQPIERKWVGMSISGGGIRSATLGLGILQAFARRGLISRLHYLSTVSGGGYIGGWLMSWIRRLKHTAGADRTIRDSERAEERLGVTEGAVPGMAEPHAVHFLRQYSNYLAPRLGLWSADSIAFISVYLRNLMLNQFTLLPVLLAVLMLPRLAALLVLQFRSEAHLVAFGGCVALVSMLIAAAGVKRNSCAIILEDDNLENLPDNSGQVSRRVVLPLLVYAAVSTITLWAEVSVFGRTLSQPVWFAIGAGLCTFFWSAASIFSGLRWKTLLVLAALFLCLVSLLLFRGRPFLLGGLLVALGAAAAGTYLYSFVSAIRSRFKQSIATKGIDVVQETSQAIILWSPIAAVGAGGFLCLFVKLLQGFPADRPSAVWHVLTFAVPIQTVGILLVGIVLLGLIGRQFPDSVREWWARVGGIQVLSAITWMILCLMSIYLPLSIEQYLTTDLHLTSSISLNWAKLPGLISVVSTSIATIAAGLRAARTSGGDKEQKRKIRLWTMAAPPAFVLLILALMSVVLHLTLPHLPNPFGVAATPIHEPETATLEKMMRGVLHPVVEPEPDRIFLKRIHQQEEHGWRRIEIERKSPATAPTATQATVTTTQQAATSSEHEPALISPYYWHIVDSTIDGRLLVMTAGLLLLTWLFGARVDVNEFSLHNSYRNRLMRCYMGASNPNRKPQPFTGFSEHDNLAMKDLQGLTAPYLIMNATLNITGGKELALQTRKGKSFIFTPLYCGYDLVKQHSVSRLDHAEQVHLMTFRKGVREELESLLKKRFQGPRKIDREPAYVKTELYGRALDTRSERAESSLAQQGLTIGTAMAASGAALSSNLGYHTRGALSFLLTLFSVRLGWWFGNPRYMKEWMSPFPRSSLKCLLNELTARTSDSAREVYVSDGGHFENLGLYELVKRKCRLIICCDAAADPGFAFRDLAHAIEHCRIDFGAEIKIDVSKLKPGQKLGDDDEFARVSDAHFATGEVRFADGTRGKLIYLKPSLARDLPLDLLHYASEKQAYPHQSTLDQFFDERQFESYRALGEIMGEAAAVEIEKYLEPVATKTQSTAASA